MKTPTEEALALIEGYGKLIIAFDGETSYEYDQECALIYINGKIQEVKKFKGYMSRKRVEELEKIKLEIERL